MKIIFSLSNIILSFLCIIFIYDTSFGNTNIFDSNHLVAITNQRHQIQYHASGRAKSGTYEFGCSTHFILNVPGKTLREAKINGLPKAKKKARGLLLKEAKKRYKDAKILSWDVN